jgi:hypothetical protein
MQITVSKVEKKTTQKGKSYTMVNGKYYCWNEKLVFEQGGTYEVEIEGEQYPKIVKATKLNTQPTTSQNGFVKGNGGDNRDKTMLLAYAKDIALKVLERSEEKNTYQLMIDGLKVTAFSYHALTKLLESQEKGYDFLADLQLGQKIWELKDIQSIMTGKVEEPDPEEEPV